MSDAPALTQQTSVTNALLTRDALAARLGLSLRTLDNMVKTRQFPSGVRIGRFLYWTEASVQTWQKRVFQAQESWKG